MQGDTASSSSRTSSLTVQLQQAWLHSQIPKVSKPLPLPKSFSSSRASPRSSAPAKSSSSAPAKSSSSAPAKSSSSSSFSSRYASKKPENLSNLAAIRSSPPLASGPGSGSDITSDGSGRTPSSTLSRESSGWTPSSTLSRDSSGFSDWSSPGLPEDGDPWDIMSPSPAAASLLLESPKKKHARLACTDSYSIYVNGMLQDDALAHMKCMGHESLAYQAVHNELADLIGAFTPHVQAEEESKVDECSTIEPPKASKPHSGTEDVENWIESLLNAPPPMPPAELQDESDGILSKPDSADPSDNGSCHGGPERALPPPPLQEEPDLSELLIRCAEAVHADDVCTANALVGEIRQHSSPFGTGVQRLAHYFTEGLVARLSGSGADLYGAISYRPSATEMVRAYHMFQTNCPYVSLGHAFSNNSLLKVFEGASRVHIVDYGILYGFQWPPFIKELAARPGGPPRLRITGIDFPQPGFKPAARLEETGKRLAELANIYGVPFEFQAVASKWENVQPAALGLRHDEVLAVSCIYRLRHLLDESVMPSCPRKVVLNRIRSMNPKVFITAVVSGSYNVPFFMTRFRECLDHYSYAFDAMDSVVPRDCDVRILLEREIFGREILNVVACEGMERVERPDTYSSWQRRLQNAGFKLLPLEESVTRTSKEMLKAHHKDFGVAQDGGWLLLGWKNQVVKGLAMWQ